MAANNNNYNNFEFRFPHQSQGQFQTFLNQPAMNSNPQFDPYVFNNFQPWNTGAFQFIPDTASLFLLLLVVPRPNAATLVVKMMQANKSRVQKSSGGLKNKPECCWRNGKRGSIEWKVPKITRHGKKL